MSQDCSLSLDPASESIQLRGELTFATVNKVLTESVTLFEAIPSLKIDLSAVTNSDSAGLALLVSWLRSAKQAGKQIVFANIPEQLLVIADISGVDELLVEHEK